MGGDGYKDENSKWDPIEVYKRERLPVAEDHNTAKAIIIGLKYVGDCILDAKTNNKT